MNNRFISYLVLTLFSSLSWLHSQSVNLDSFQKIQALNIQECAVIQKEWNIKVVPTIVILKKGKEVERYEPGISMRFDEIEVFNKVKKEIK